MKNIITLILFSAVCFVGCSISCLLTGLDDIADHYFWRTGICELLLAFVFALGFLYCVFSAVIYLRKSAKSAVKK